MEFIESIVQAITKAAGGNQLLSGGIAVWMMGVLTWALRTVPLRLLQWFQSRFIARMIFDNSSWDLRNLQLDFDAWYNQTRWFRMVRHFRMNVSARGESILSPGASLNLFVLNGRLYWFTTTRDTAERMVEQTVYNTVVSTFSFWRSNDAFQKFVDQFSRKLDPSEEKKHYSVMSYRRDYWQRVHQQVRRDWDDLVHNDAIKHRVNKAIDNFLRDKEVYRRLNLPHKLTFMFHSEPGTGKSSLVSVIASRLGFNVYPLNLEGKTTYQLTQELATIDEGAVILMEDIDSFTEKREGIESHDGYEAGDLMPVAENRNVPRSAKNAANRPVDTKASLSGMLNILDGVVPLNNRVVIITTNKLSALDPAMYRPGRVDQLIEVPRYTSNEVWRYIAKLYPETPFTAVPLIPMRGCEVAAIVRDHFDDGEGVVNTLVEKYSLGVMNDSRCDSYVESAVS